jgi:hypothetical protein
MCDICCTPFNKVVRKQVVCPQCPALTCKDCVQKYLVTSIQDPHCMVCRVPWDVDIIRDALSGTFLKKEYKQHREKVLIDRQKSLLPATMPAAAKRSDKVKKLHRILMLVRARIEIDDEIARLRSECTGTPFEEKEKQVYNGHCPSDGCKGFLDNKWTCMLCIGKVCKKCRCPDGDDHVCSEDAIKTVALLKKDTKHCPQDGCGTLIYKIEGCDQMFCTICNTTFSWKTREIVVKGARHNPHYFKWLDAQRKAGIDPHAQHPPPQPQQPQQQCDLSYMTIIRHIDKNKLDIDVGRAFRFAQHIRAVEIPRNSVTSEVTYTDLRIKYILNDIDETVWANRLHRAEKRDERVNAIRQILEMMVIVMDDLFRKLLLTFEQSVANTMKMEMNNLVIIVNTELEKLSKKYKTVKRYVTSDTWELL